MLGFSLSSAAKVSRPGPEAARRIRSGTKRGSEESWDIGPTGVDGENERPGAARQQPDVGKRAFDGQTGLGVGGNPVVLAGLVAALFPAEIGIGDVPNQVEPRLAIVSNQEGEVQRRDRRSREDGGQKDQTLLGKEE